MIKGDFIDNLPKIYGIYTGGFIIFIMLMAILEQMGVGLAMDDFGTGHSSLSHVSHLPISMIKIDRSFVKNCSKRKTDEAILKAIVTMGHALGLKVLAEGVETEVEMDFLAKLGCSHMQGYLFGRPVPAEEFTEEWAQGFDFPVRPPRS